MSLSSRQYSIPEPVSAADIVSVSIDLNRYGDTGDMAQVRLSTRDSSAVSGIDYGATSTNVRFESGTVKFQSTRVLQLTANARRG